MKRTQGDVRVQRTICISLLVTALAGCGGGGGGKSTSSTPAAPPPTTPTTPVSKGIQPGPDAIYTMAQNPGETRLDCNYAPQLQGGMLEAVAYGNYNKASATPEAFVDAALGVMDAQSVAYDADLRQLYGLNADGSRNSSSLTSITWQQTHDAWLLQPTLGANATALTINVDANLVPVNGRNPVAVFGREASSKTPYLVMGRSPFRLISQPQSDAQTNQFMLNAVKLLTGKSPGATLRLTLAHLEQNGTYFPDETQTRKWFSDRFGANVTFNAADACDGDLLDSCLSAGTDLLVISQSQVTSTDVQKVKARVEQALKNKTPVLFFAYSRSVSSLGEALMSLLQVSTPGTNTSRLEVAALDPSVLLGGKDPGVQALKSMLQGLKSGQYGFTLPRAQQEDLAAYQAEFDNGAQMVRSMMTGFDRSRTYLFAECGREVPKLLALLGDRLRQDVKYPLRVASSSQAAFVRAQYADLSMLNLRAYAPAQPDRGDFDGKDLSKVTPVSRTVKLTSRVNYRATGAYALPGRLMKVTRKDSSAVTVRFFVNPLHQTTFVWNDGYYGGYSRPSFLKSQEVELKSGQTVVFNSAHGGPVQLSFDANEQPVEVAFENVGEHPYWAGAADNAKFAANLSSGVYNWVEVATDGFELLSREDHIKNSLKDANWSTPEKLAAAIEKYTYNYTHIVAGFQGRGIDRVAEIADWAAGKGMTIPITDLVKHGNMDRPYCGDGCSGNPYDAGWAFSPIGHGDIHELGHSLESDEMKASFNGKTSDGHATTNFYPYYVLARWYEDQNLTPKENFSSGPMPTVFAEMQKAYLAGDRSGSLSARMRDYMEANGTGSGSYNYNYVLFQQLMMHAKRKGKLQNGHHLVARMHLMLHAYRNATASETAWSDARAKIGFGSYTVAEAKAISQNDLLLLMVSYSGELDFRDYFDLWGIDATAKAKAQVASYAYPVVERGIWRLGFDSPTSGRALISRAEAYSLLPVDGKATW